MKEKYEDLMKERWIRKRDSGEIQWETKDGRSIPIKDMTDDHLENTIRVVEKMRAKSKHYDDMGVCDDPNY